MKRPKITIVGAGNVGSTTALLLAIRNLGDIIIWNRTESTAKARALDLAELSPHYGFDAHITGTGSVGATRNSDIIIFTAGTARKPGMSRDDLLEKNAGIVGPLVKQLAKASPKAILIMVTNPLDAMVYLAKRATGYSKKHVMGMAGMLDTARYKYFIADKLKISVKDISAMVLGSHGDEMVPLPEHTSVNGIPITQMLKKSEIKQIIERTRKGGAEIVKLEKSGSAYFAPAASITEMVESIILDKKRILPCASYLSGEYGIKGIFMGVPTRLGHNGAEKVIELKLSASERKEFNASAKKVKALIRAL